MKVTRGTFVRILYTCIGVNFCLIIGTSCALDFCLKIHLKILNVVQSQKIIRPKYIVTFMFVLKSDCSIILTNPTFCLNRLNNKVTNWLATS